MSKKGVAEVAREELVKRIWRIIEEERKEIKRLSAKPNLRKPTRRDPDRLNFTGRICVSKHEYTIDRLKEILEIV